MYICRRVYTEQPGKLSRHDMTEKLEEPHLCHITIKANHTCATSNQNVTYNSHQYLQYNHPESSYTTVYESAI